MSPGRGRIGWQARACERWGGSPAENTTLHNVHALHQPSRQPLHGETALATALPPPHLVDVVGVIGKSGHHRQAAVQHLVVLLQGRGGRSDD